MSGATVTKSDVRMTKCGACSTHFTPPGRGRPKRFCSGACRKRVHLARHRLAEVMGTDDSGNQDSTRVGFHPSRKAIEHAAQATPLEQDVAEKVAEKYIELKRSVPIETERLVAPKVAAALNNTGSIGPVLSGSLTAAMSATDVEQLRNEAEAEIQDGYSEELAAILATVAALVLAGGFAISVLSTPAVVVPAAVAARDVAGVAVGFAVRAAQATFPDDYSESDFVSLLQSIRRNVADALIDDMNDAVEQALVETEGQSEAQRGQAVRDVLDPSSTAWRAHAEMVASSTDGGRRCWCGRGCEARPSCRDGHGPEVA